MNHDPAYWLVFTAGAAYFALAVRHANHYCKAWHLLVWVGCALMSVWYRLIARRAS